MSRSRKRAKNTSQVARQLAEEVTELVVAYVARARAAASPPPPRDTRTLREATDDFHRTFVLQALEAQRKGKRWNILATATALGVARSRLYNLIDHLGLPRKYQGPAE